MDLNPLKDPQSPRHLIFKALADTAGNIRKTLEPGQAKPFSFFRPSLEGGEYLVSATQTIKTSSEAALSDPARPIQQKFTVATPRYQLPDDAIKSLYPPPGYGAPVETLPHIVFNDRYFPWERDASDTIMSSDTSSPPWIALLIFEGDELRLTPELSVGDHSIFRNVQGKETKNFKQDANFAVSISPDDIKSLVSCVSPIPADSVEERTASIKTVFVKPKLFNELFRNNSLKAEEQRAPDISRYAFLAHVQQINAAGMADAGVHEEVYYSLVLSHRVGPLNKAGPVPVTVHVISLEGVEKMKFPVSEDTQCVVLSSLYSWTYTCLPPGSVSIREKMQNLGKTLGMLRTTAGGLESSKGDDRQRYVSQRLKEGYTLTRYRVQTGELTAAIFRGALSPVSVPHPLSKFWSMHSDSGMDLQILDQKLGITDITYYAAWQLGRTTAISDSAFSTAIVRLRKQIHVTAMKQAKAEILRARRVYLTKKETISGTQDVLNDLTLLQGPQSASSEPSNLLSRWTDEKEDPVDLSLGNTTLLDNYAARALEVAQEIGKSTDTGEIYNELNRTNNADWKMVLGWILDKMYLSSVPYQYLVVDPSQLPPESLRFFYIDPNWIDAFIDGAISIGNHLDIRYDKVRVAVKRLINQYLETPLPNTSETPPIPCYGFFIRSDLISHCPDLRVEAEFDPPKSGALPSILRQVSASEGVLLCLLDAPPFGSSGRRLKGLKFTQPPHQQSFEVGSHINEKELRTSYKRIYNQDDGSDKAKPLCDDETLTRAIPEKPDSTTIFYWGAESSIRTIQFPAWSNRLLDLLQTHMPKSSVQTFNVTAMSSAIVSIQLAKPVSELQIKTSQGIGSLSPTTGADKRTLWIREPHVSNNQESQRVLTAEKQSPPSRSFFLSLAPALRRTRLADIPETTLAPNITPIRPPSPRLAAEAARALPDPQRQTTDIDTPLESDILEPTGGPAERPMYALQIFPVGNVLAKKQSRSFIPMGKRQDLVFSVTLVNPYLVGMFYIREIWVIIPVGKISSQGDACMMQDYQGPGPSMLSNLRFNVLFSLDASRENALLRLVPRSTANPGLHFQLAKEISFVLSLVDVNEFDKNLTKTSITVVEHFKDEFGNKFNPFARKHIVVLKKHSIQA